jgi:O-antigen/teichoic acid export membrane protein
LKNTNKIIEAESTRQIKRGAIVSYIGIAINILAGFLYTPWMIQQIGQGNFGLYTLAISLISIFTIDLGLSAAVSRFVSKYIAEGKQENVNNILGISLRIYLIIDLIILIILIIVYLNLDLIYKELTSEELSKFKVVYSIAAMFSILSFPFIPLNSILISYEKFVPLKLCDLLNKLLSVLLIIVALIIGFGLYTLVTLNAISGLITIIIKLIIVKRSTPIKINYKFYNKKMLNEIFNFSLWSAVVSISQRFIFNITPTILGAFSGSMSIAVFGIASSLEGYVYTIANAINGLFLPKVTRLVKNDNASSNLLQLMIKIGRIQLTLISLIFIGFLLIGKDFINLWVGKEYITAYYCVVLLIIPSIFYLPQQIGNTAIMALNKVKLQAYVFIGMAALNIILSIVFSRFWGALGASLAVCISYMARNIAMNIIYYREIKINVINFFIESYFKFFFPLLLSVGVILFVFYLMPTTNISWSIFVLKVFMIISIYLLIMWCFAFNEYERVLFKSIIYKCINIFIK